MTDYYCDFGAGSHGSGTFASPYNTLDSTASYATFTSADRIWIRRNVTRTFAVNTGMSVNMCLVELIGWPTGTDTYYSVRPSVAQATWDADTAVHPKIAASANTALSLFAQNNNNIRIYNLDIDYNALTTPAAGTYAIMSQGANCINTIENVVIRFLISGTYGDGSANVYALRSVGGFAQTYKAKNFTFYFVNNGGSVTASPAIIYFMCFYSTITSSCCINVNSYFLNSVLKSDFGGPFLAGVSNGGIKAIAGYWKNCTIEFTTHNKDAAVYLSSNYDASSGDDCTLDGCTIKSVTSGTVNNNILSIYDAIPTNTNRKFRIKNLSILGFNDVNLQVIGNTPAYATIDATTVTSCAASMASIAKLNATTLDVGATTYASTHTGQVLVIKQVNSSCTITRGSGVTVLLSGLDGDPSIWRKHDTRGTVSVATPTRSGGETFSVKMLSSVAYAVIADMLCSHVRGLDTIFTAVLTGTRTVTIFGYYKAFSAQTPSTENIAIEVDAITAAGSTILESRLFDFSALTSDSSTWTGVSGGTPFKCSIIFTAAADQNVAVRFLTSLSEAAGEIYFDPKPVVT